MVFGSPEKARVMFFLSKVLGFLVLPSNAMVIAALTGIVLMRTKKSARAGFRLTAAALVLIVAFGTLPLGRFLMLPLEQRFPPYDAGSGAPDGIVVLGGVIEPEVAFPATQRTSVPSCMSGLFKGQLVNAW